MDVSNEIINADYNVSPALFAGETRVLVRSIFNTIQGEMPFAGQPATFLRLGGCNRGAKADIGCAGCDTAFAVADSTYYEASELAQLIRDKMHEDNDGTPRLLVVTGGEPLLQSDALTLFFNLLGDLLSKSFFGDSPRVQFETNGDFDPQNLLRNVEVFQNETFDVYFVISPKSPFKKNPWWTSDGIWESGVFYIRRVINAEPNSVYNKVPKQIEELTSVWGSRVYLSPQTFYKPGSQQEEGDSRQHIDWQRTENAIKRAMDEAARLGCYVSLQAHAYANIR